MTPDKTQDISPTGKYNSEMRRAESTKEGTETTLVIHNLLIASVSFDLILCLSSCIDAMVIEQEHGDFSSQLE